MRRRRADSFFSDERDSKRRKASKKITEEDLKEYMARKAQKKALKVAKKLKSLKLIEYSNYSFGDTDLNETFVWKKKIERDVVVQGVPLDAYSLEAETHRQLERMAEIEKANNRREQRARQKAEHEEEMAKLARERARAEFEDWQKKEDAFHFEQSKVRSEIRRGTKPIDVFTNNLSPSDDIEIKIKAPHPILEISAMEQGEVNLNSQVPKYSYQVQMGYLWNRYNRTHFNRENPPSKLVQRYKFIIFYPNLVDKNKVPTYRIETDGNNSETCIIKFEAGPPYEDIAFRIVNKEWEYSHKKGYKCTFEHGILRLYFSFKNHPYRRGSAIAIKDLPIHYLKLRLASQNLWHASHITICLPDFLLSVARTLFQQWIIYTYKKTFEAGTYHELKFRLESWAKATVTSEDILGVLSIIDSSKDLASSMVYIEPLMNELYLGRPCTGYPHNLGCAWLHIGGLRFHLLFCKGSRVPLLKYGYKYSHLLERTPARCSFNELWPPAKLILTE